ncbi:MAG UNVERIFIED_CONTAM: hypothetical protein LVT10_21460 [Anaerolineae bacterium]
MTNTTWSIAFWTLLVVLGVFALAQIPGLGLSITRVPNASVGAIGSYTVQVFGGEIVVNQLLVLAGFIAFTMFSLFLAAGAIGFLLTFLNQVSGSGNAKTPSRVDFASNLPRIPRFVATEWLKPRWKISQKPALIPNPTRPQTGRPAEGGTTNMSDAPRVQLFATQTARTRS